MIKTLLSDVTYFGGKTDSVVSRRTLLGGGAASVGAWLFTEWLAGRPHRRINEMQAAASRMEAAIRAVRAEKVQRGILQPPDVDPNRTGLIGPGWSETTTTQGILPAKRTATNPDLAAALVGLVDQLSISPGSHVLTLMSGSLVGANVAVLTALEALGLVPVSVSSLGASMYGATDVEFTWLDIEAVLLEKEIITRGTQVAVLGSNGAIGQGMLQEGQDALRRSAARHDVPIVTAPHLEDVIKGVLSRTQVQKPWPLVVNVGGSVLSLGTCEEAESYPPGLIRHPLPCRDGDHGLLAILSAQGVPVLHVLNLRRLTADLGLPYDPIPLPRPGKNPRVYGAPAGLT